MTNTRLLKLTQGKRTDAKTQILREACLPGPCNGPCDRMLCFLCLERVFRNKMRVSRVVGSPRVQKQERVSTALIMDVAFGEVLGMNYSTAVPAMLFELENRRANVRRPGDVLGQFAPPRADEPQNCGLLQDPERCRFAAGTLRLSVRHRSSCTCTSHHAPDVLLSTTGECPRSLPTGERRLRR